MCHGAVVPHQLMVMGNDATLQESFSFLSNFPEIFNKTKKWSSNWWIETGFNWPQREILGVITNKYSYFASC